VALTIETLRVAVVSWGAGVTLETFKVRQTLALAVIIAGIRGWATTITPTGLAVGIVEVAKGTSIAARALKVGLAKALSVGLVTDLLRRAHRTANTILTDGEVEVAVATLVAGALAVDVAASALSGLLVADGIKRTNQVAVARDALRKVVEAQCAAITVAAGIVGLAGAVASVDLADFVPCAVDVAVARLAGWVAVVAFVALAASGPRKLGTTLALPSDGSTVASGDGWVTIAGLADIRRV
jgi:hypothetical protein